jgi:phage gp16-like protein
MMARPHTRDQRKAKLAAIHIAQKQLDLDDDAYRALLARVTGRRSAREMDLGELRRVLDEMRRALRALQPRKAACRGQPTVDAPAFAKIEAQLADMGLAWSYADAIARRMFGIERMQWVRRPAQRKAIIAALHAEQVKRRLSGQIDRLLAALGERPEDAELWARRLWRSPAPGWRRKPKLAERMVDYLHWVLEGRRQAALQHLADTLARVASGRAVR